MRVSPLLRQMAAGASGQPKLPLPTFYPSSIPRLRPSKEDFLPSVVNAPTTLPPVFIAPREVKDSEINSIGKRVYYKAKSYYQFYKTGIKQFNHNRKMRNVLKRELMKNLTYIKIPGSGNIAVARSEFQLLIRTKRDWRKMPGKLSFGDCG